MLGIGLGLTSLLQWQRGPAAQHMSGLLLALDGFPLTLDGMLLVLGEKPPVLTLDSLTLQFDGIDLVLGDVP